MNKTGKPTYWDEIDIIKKNIKSNPDIIVRFINRLNELGLIEESIFYVLSHQYYTNEEYTKYWDALHEFANEECKKHVS